MSSYGTSVLYGMGSVLSSIREAWNKVPRMKRELSIEGVVTLLVLLVHIATSWANHDAVIKQLQDALSSQSKIISSMLADVNQLKSQERLQDYEIDQALKHIDSEQQQRRVFSR